MDAQAYAATFLTLAFLTHMLAKAATSALFTLGSLPIVNTQSFSTAFFAPSLEALMNANAAPTTFSAIVSYPIVLTDTTPIAFFTLGLGALMNADAASTTVLTIGSMSIVLTDTGSTAMLALAFLTSVFAEASTTIFAATSHSLMRADAASTTVNTIAFPTIVLAPRVLVFAFFGIFLTLCLLHLVFLGLADVRAHVLHAQLFMALVLRDAVPATFETIDWQTTVNAVLLGLAHFCRVVCCHNIVRSQLLTSVMQPRENKRLPGWECHGSAVVKSKNVLTAELSLCLFCVCAHATLTQKYFVGLSKSCVQKQKWPLQIAMTRKKKNTTNTTASLCRPSCTVLCMLCNKVKTWFNQNTFLLPPCYGQHRHEWQKLDIDTVGCKICGIVHCCSCSKNIVPCQKEFQ